MLEAGDSLPEGHSILEVRVGKLMQLFNSLDASPFHHQDLDPRAEEYIVDWGSELPRSAKLGLLVHLGRAPGSDNEALRLGESMRAYFADRARVSRRDLKHLFWRGRMSLLIGLLFLSLAIFASELVGRLANRSGLTELLQSSFIIGGWVALWGPIEIFLYDWWPVLGKARLHDRLAIMPVRIRYERATPGEDWREDWPAKGPLT